MSRPDAPPPIEPTLPLGGEARGYWDRHAVILKRRQIVTTQDLDSFTLLCVTWGMISAFAGLLPGADAYREMIQFTNLSKQYQALAKQFGLLPRERKMAKMEAPPKRKRDEFGL